MPNTSIGLGLPKYSNSKEQQHHVASKRRTARLIQALWSAASVKQRNDPEFLCLLVQCSWTTTTRTGGRESTRKWRNRNIARYLDVPYSSDKLLASAMEDGFKGLNASKLFPLLERHTGISHYRTSHHEAVLKFVTNHSPQVSLAFRRVSSVSADLTDKIGKVASIIEGVGLIPATKLHLSPFNALTPVLSCLDPQCNFPIMNSLTQRLLRLIGEKPDINGVVSLSKLIGPISGVKNAFELDEYANREAFPKPLAHKPSSGGDFKDVGFKSETDSTAELAAKSVTIRKLHNKLTNDLRDYLLWRHRTPKECRFDALVLGWKEGRDLLIEAKTSSEGTSGRSQIRQAIGQLYDYRFTHMPNNKVDLAVLLRKEPSRHVKDLLATLKIELLWFRGKMLVGTISL
jgi:hypothetical protein